MPTWTNTLCLLNYMYTIVITTTHTFVQNTDVHTIHIPCPTQPIIMSLKSNTSVPLKSIMALRAGRVGKVGSVKVL